MSDDLFPGSPAGPRDPGKGSGAHLDHSLWRRLAEASTVEEFCASWLGLQAQMIGEVFAGVVLLADSGAGSLAPRAVWPRGFDRPEMFKGAVERAVRERKGVVTRNDTDEAPRSPEERRFRLAYPVCTGDRVHGVVALEIASRPEIQLGAAMRQIQWGVAWLQNWVLRNVTAPEGTRSGGRLSVALELTALTLEETRFKAAATALVTELATRLECDRVSLGFVGRRQVRIHALSHSAQFGKQMNLMRAIGMAMDEALDQHAVLVYPERESRTHDVLHAHKQLARAHGDLAICSVPFFDPEDRPIGAITLERSGGDPFDPETVELCDSVAALVGPILEEKRKNDRLIVTKIGDSLWSQVKLLVGPRHTVRKLVAAGLVALALFFAFARGPYRVTAKTVLEGEVQRSVTAPYSGFIDTAPVRAGDIVEEGQPLCTLDRRDLLLEQSKWSNEQQQYLLEHRRAMAEGNRAAAKVLGKKMDQARAQLALLEEQIRRAEIKAPFGGIVVSGDLSQSLGAPVETGEVLFEIAPLDSYRVMLEVDEKDIDDVEVGQSGKLVLTAMPGAELEFTVVKITPVSLSEEGRNYFRVEARLEQASARLRPGMQGFGKILIDRRRFLWIWTHDLIDWLRLWTWSWWP